MNQVKISLKLCNLKYKEDYKLLKDFNLVVFL